MKHHLSLQLALFHQIPENTFICQIFRVKKSFVLCNSKRMSWLVIKATIQQFRHFWFYIRYDRDEIISVSFSLSISGSQSIVHFRLFLNKAALRFNWITIHFLGKNSMINSLDSLHFIVGMAGFFAVAALGAYNYKNRGKVSTSVYLMQLRVAAQGTVVGTICLGLIYSMTSRYFKKDSNGDTNNQH